MELGDNLSRAKRQVQDHDRPQMVFVNRTI